MPRPTLLAALALALFAPACGDPGPADATGRLWVSELVRGPRESFSAFVTTGPAGKTAYGFFYRGSAYAGRQEALSWTTTGADRASMRLLQDGSDHALTIRACTPTTGFHHCIELAGDPAFAGRYQSRKRWSLPRRGQVASIAAVIDELGAVDADLLALSTDAGTD